LVKLKHIKKPVLQKGHQLLIALLLFMGSFQCYGIQKVRIDSLSTKQVWLASQVLPGSGQFINKQYWKMPVFYGGMGGLLYLAHNSNNSYKVALSQFNASGDPDERFYLKEKYTSHRIERNLFYYGVAAVYVSSVADALVIHSKGKHSPLTATVLSALVPGMGQAYNQKIWKMPVIYASMASLYYLVDFNQRGFKRFGTALDNFPNDEFGGARAESELNYFREAYRRNRDLSIISLVGVYLLNIIDANVDAHLHDWDVSDNLAFDFKPTIGKTFSMSSGAYHPTMGLSFSYKF
jgi:hypothetical protein